MVVLLLDKHRDTVTFVIQICPINASWHIQYHLMVHQAMMKLAYMKADNQAGIQRTMYIISHGFIHLWYSYTCKYSGQQVTQNAKLLSLNENVEV